READSGLHALPQREIARALSVAEVVRHRLLAEDMLARLERRPRQLEVCVARRADVDEVDVVAADQLERIAGRGRDVEFTRPRTCAIDQGVRNGDNTAA